jgi:glutathione S-transferase
MDRFFDLYVSTPMQQLVGEVLRAAAGSDSRSDEWRGRLDTAYAWLDRELAGREWATGGEFTMADCSAGPALLYAGWVHPIPARLGTLAAYRRRLLARPSYARAVDEARPHRHLFPLPIPPGD